MPSLPDALAEAVDPPVALFLACLLSVVAVGMLVSVFRHGRIIRLVIDTPTERIASATQGFTELHGKAIRLKGPEIRSPGGKTCVWWTALGGIRPGEPDESFKYEGLGLEQLLTNSMGPRRTSDELFGICDDTGICIIDPEHADVKHSSTGIRPSLSGMRIREKYILEGDDLYVIGKFRTLNHEGVAQEFGAEIAARIKLWKQERMPELVAEFDRNGDGELDPEEWHAVREKAIGELEREYRQRAMDETPHLIHASDDGRPFVIAAAREADYLELLSRAQWVRGSIGIGMLFVAALFLKLTWIA